MGHPEEKLAALAGAGPFSAATPALPERPRTKPAGLVLPVSGRAGLVTETATKTRTPSILWFET